MKHLAFVAACVAAAAMSAAGGGNVVPRGTFQNARTVFEKTGHGTVAFLGGSITEMEGYRPLVCNDLTLLFPTTKFTFIPAGISSTCSSTGAFRLDRDILSKGKIDLLFVEFAVNDDQDGRFTREQCVRGMEGIIRHARMSNPAMDIVMTFFVNESMLATLQKGGTPLTIEAHGAVAERYGIPTVNHAKEVAERISAGRLTWKVYGGVHPALAGNQICAELIHSLFEKEWADPLPDNAKVVPHPLPQPLDACSYARGRFVDPKNARDVKGFTLGVPDWPKVPGGKRERFLKEPMLCATEPGAEASLDFTGTCIGAYLLAGPDAGTVEVRVDGGAAKTLNLLHPYSAGLQYPYTAVFADGLADSRHTLQLRFPDIPANKGKAVRIMQFTAN